ncbi:hypothetical protein [Nitrosomonas ureae]|uniref:Uncharacterized protein n=1 Tax=Nitrosomonas ureae TaxID=44577 RepID=A0A1H9AT12_9PROT|nr:hypothetical protein [Nitrosomonas ureae]SEP79914.1 hypothetical protein SAMN05421510_10052 [Nitrosomonas ureae]
MLVHIKTLSLWEIAHYWHDCDPKAPGSHQIPLKVRDTLLVLIKTPNKKISVFVEKRRAYLLKLLRYIQEICTESFLQNLQNSIDKKVFEKRLFNSMFLTRNSLARWCFENNEPLPKFWFPDNDKYPYDLDDDEEIEDSGRYKFLVVYDETKKVDSELEVKRSTPITVTNNAAKAAKAKHAPTNAVKDRFISFYMEEGIKHPSKIAAAKHFLISGSTATTSF